jgi:hypothetical protein
VTASPFATVVSGAGWTRTSDQRIMSFVVDETPKHERERVRQDLLDYRHRDALAMVRLVETLEGLPRVAP